MIEVTISIFELVIMPSMSSVVQLTCFCAHVIVDTHAVVFVVTMQLAVLKISNNFSSYSVVHQTLAIRPLSERRKEQPFGFVVLWVKNTTCAGVFS